MSVWHVTEADRDAEGKIRTLADLLPAAGPEETTPRPRWRPSRLELAGIVVGPVLAAALLAALNVFWPAPGPRSVPTARPAPTTAPAPTCPPTAAATTTPTTMPEPSATPAPPPTPEPIIIVQPPPCDPLVNPRYTVHLDVSPIGSVTGVSCNSL